MINIQVFGNETMDYNLVKELVVENEKLEQFRRKYSIFASSLDKNVEQVCGLNIFILLFFKT